VAVLLSRQIGLTGNLGSKLQGRVEKAARKGKKNGKSLLPELTKPA
jgi:hypothetical protein